ncbi:MAG: DUF1592 domain-containing protein [Polyangiaceae bacterium]
MISPGPKLRLLGPSIVLSAIAAACTGNIGDRLPGPGGVGGPGPGGGPDDKDPQAECAGAKLDVGASPMRRLTRVEYDNTVRDLLGDLTAPARDFAPDEKAGGFDANSGAAVSEAQVEQYVDAAEQLATAAVADKLDAWLDCDAAQTGCVEPFIVSFGKRAFRQPLDGETVQSFVELYEAARAKWDGESGVRLVIQAMLSSPQFLYHLELGVSGAEAVVPLLPHELASRLSYFLWQSMPDDDLLAAAEDGKLDTPEGLEAEARRLLADDRARDGIASFSAQWLLLGALDDLTKDESVFPEWTPELADSMRAETLAFVQDVVFGDDPRLEALLSAPFSFVDARLAALYGVPEPAPGKLTKVQLDPSQRAGILTQASFLAGQAHAADPSWVHRGKFVREQLLCQVLPVPPADVDMSTLQDPDRLENPECAGCHTLMDPIGYGFDGYDAIGKYQGGAAGGEIVGSTNSLDVAGTFTDPVDLAHKLAGSADVRDCMAQQWVRFAARRPLGSEDDCSVTHVQEQFAASEQNLVELLVAVAKTDVFRYRRADAE